MKRTIILAALLATVVPTAGCALLKGVFHDDENRAEQSQGARAEARDRARAQEDAKARLCASLRDRKAREAKGC